MKKQVVIILGCIAAILAIICCIIKNNKQVSINERFEEFATDSDVNEVTVEEQISEVSTETDDVQSTEVQEDISSMYTSEIIQDNLDVAMSLAAALGVTNIDWNQPINKNNSYIDYIGNLSGDNVTVEFVLNDSVIINAYIITNDGDPVDEQDSSYFEITSEMSESEKLVIEYFNNIAPGFVIEEHTIDTEYIPAFVKKYDVQTYYIVGYEDSQYTAIVYNGEVLVSQDY